MALGHRNQTAPVYSPLAR